MCTPLDSWEIITLDSEAVYKAEKEATDVEQLRITVSRYEEERKLMLDEISQLKDMLKREVIQADTEKSNNTALNNNNMLIRQKLDAQLHNVRAEFDNLKVSTNVCKLQFTFTKIGMKIHLYSTIQFI